MNVSIRPESGFWPPRGLSLAHSRRCKGVVLEQLLVLRARPLGISDTRTCASWPSMSFSLVLVVVAFATHVASLNITRGSLAGTAFDGDHLSDKQLGILRYLAQQTSLSSPSWSGWHYDPNQDSNESLRYAIAGMAYAVASLAYRTPAYVAPYVAVLKDCLHRMVEQRTWNYVSMFEDYRKQSTFPDPVAYKNIMYSGHLLQMLALYEDLSGDFSFSVHGWDFKWNASVTIHYNTSKLVQAILEEANRYGVGLGVPCEPMSVFVICNSFPRNGLLLYDLLHNTSVAPRVIAQWQETILKYGLTGAPVVGTGTFFKLVYLMPMHFWESLASEGIDVWALAWMGPWWNAAVDNTTLQSAHQHVAQSKQWRTTAGNGTQQCVLESNWVGSKIFPFPSDITTSFVPMIEAQYAAAGNSSSVPHRRECSTLHLEQFGEILDYDADGVADAYLYNTSVGYHDWVTANLLLSYTLGSPSALYEQYHHDVPTFVRSQSAPQITHCSFPMVHVRKAVFRDESLLFEILRGDSIGSVRDFEIHVAVACDGVRVYLGGASWSAWKCNSGALLIVAPIPLHGEIQQWAVTV